MNLNIILKEYCDLDLLMVILGDKIAVVGGMGYKLLRMFEGERDISWRRLLDWEKE